jgi:hypothetical protein
MTANDDTPSTGKEASGTDYEIHTDGGVSRRVFLAAAATLGGLPALGGTAAGSTDDDEGARTGDESTDYGPSTVVEAWGDLETWTGGHNKTEVQVSSHPEGIGLQLANGDGVMSVLLLPEDIEPLCRELLDAKAQTKPEAVAHSREWIVEDFREGGR